MDIKALVTTLWGAAQPEMARAVVAFVFGILGGMFAFHYKSYFEARRARKADKDLSDEARELIVMLVKGKVLTFVVTFFPNKTVFAVLTTSANEKAETSIRDDVNKSILLELCDSKYLDCERREKDLGSFTEVVYYYTVTRKAYKHWER